MENDNQGKKKKKKKKIPWHDLDAFIGRYNPGS